MCVSSRHGSTAALAVQIHDVLTHDLAGSDVSVDILAPEKVTDVWPYDAVILGSAVYMGRWMEPARKFAAEHTDALRQRPVWLFSSGPIGDPPKPAGAPADATRIAESLAARGQRVFAGRLQKPGLGVGERLIVRAIHAAEGDFRDVDDVRTWAAEIAATLHLLSEHATPDPDPSVIARQ